MSHLFPATCRPAAARLEVRRHNGREGRGVGNVPHCLVDYVLQLENNIGRLSFLEEA